MNYTLSVPCLFGLEGIVKNQLIRLGMEGVTAENGRVLFEGGGREIARANLWLRSGERVLLRVGSFPVPTPDDLFSGVQSLPWEELIPRDAAFPVKGHTLNSRLNSVSVCQKTIKKAVALRLGRNGASLPETGAKHQIQFSIMNDHAELFLDTTGPGLHKRGYRPAANAAPIRETLAASLAELARYDGFRPLIDPMCGSGTIAIESALLALNRAPGAYRRFDAEKWPLFPDSLWRDARAEALESVKDPHSIAPIFCSDIDPESVELTKENARRAHVSSLLSPRCIDALKVDYAGIGPGTLIVNPPYGERLGDIAQARKLLRAFGHALNPASRLRRYLITSDPEFEQIFEQKADKRRKLYNGMIECTLYMYYHSPKRDKGKCS